MRNWASLKKQYDAYVQEELQIIKAAYDFRFEYLKKNFSKHFVFSQEFKKRRDKLKEIKLKCLEVNNGRRD